MGIKMTKTEVGQVVKALLTYAKKVSSFYALKVRALARRIAKTGRVSQPRTCRKALMVRALEVSPFYASKLGTTFNRLGEV